MIAERFFLVRLRYNGPAGNEDYTITMGVTSATIFTAIETVKRKFGLTDQGIVLLEVKAVTPHHAEQPKADGSV